MLNEFACEYPPVDLLVAAYMGHKSPAKGGSRSTTREMRRENARILKNVPLPRTPKALDDMPAFLRTPEKMAMIDKMRSQQRTDGGSDAR